MVQSISKSEISQVWQQDQQDNAAQLYTQKGVLLTEKCQKQEKLPMQSPSSIIKLLQLLKTLDAYNKTLEVFIPTVTHPVNVAGFSIIWGYTRYCRACTSQNAERKISHSAKEGKRLPSQRTITGHLPWHHLPQGQKVCMVVCLQQTHSTFIVWRPNILPFWGCPQTVNDFGKLHRCRAAVCAESLHWPVTIRTI